MTTALLFREMVLIRAVVRSQAFLLRPIRPLRMARFTGVCLLRSFFDVHAERTRGASNVGAAG